MKRLPSLNTSRFRQTVLSVYALSSLLPVLLLMYLIHQFFLPGLLPHQADHFRGYISLAVLGMLVIPTLGFVLLAWWMKSLENFSEEVKTKTASLLDEADQIQEKENANEMVTLRRHFNALYGELQDKMDQLNEYSKMLIDSNIRLSEQAVTDSLTSLYNRRYFDQRLKEEAARADRYGFDLTLILFDLDGFKQFNDRFGHLKGDELLRNLGGLLRNLIRKSDLPFRYGGDEFAVLLPQCSLKDGAAIATKLARSVELIRLNVGDEPEPEKISISCGVAGYTRGLKNLVADADRCLYMAKSTGKGRVVCARPAPPQAQGPQPKVQPPPE